MSSRAVGPTNRRPRHINSERVAQRVVAHRSSQSDCCRSPAQHTFKNAPPHALLRLYGRFSSSSCYSYCVTNVDASSGSRLEPRSMGISIRRDAAGSNCDPAIEAETWVGRVAGWEFVVREEFGSGLIAKILAGQVFDFARKPSVEGSFPAIWIPGFGAPKQRRSGRRENGSRTPTVQRCVECVPGCGNAAGKCHGGPSRKC
jgi:hypothetical protein